MKTAWQLIPILTAHACVHTSTSSLPSQGARAGGGASSAQSEGGRAGGSESSHAGEEGEEQRGPQHVFLICEKAGPTRTGIK